MEEGEDEMREAAIASIPSLRPNFNPSTKLKQAQFAKFEYSVDEAVADKLKGSTSEAESTKKLLSSKVIVFILLLCVILTTLVFIASVIFYVYQRNKCPNERPLFLSDKETSYNSGSNLISRRAISVPEHKFYIGSPANLITGMGGSNHVYCGHLKDGGVVAVKRMKALGGPDVQSDF